MEITTSQEGWLKSRQTGVGSSDSPVLALPPEEVFKKTSLDTYISKKSPIDAEKDGDNVNFRRGHTYEPLAITLAEAKLGMKIYSPQNDHERWNDYQARDPDRPHVYADFDGLREDGWVVEVKSPMQRIADKIRETGLKDYYQVQGQHLVHIASVAELPHLGRLPKGCPGVCFVIYECESVSVQIYEIPRNEQMIEAILSNADDFWFNHVMVDKPPTENFTPATITIPKQKGEYEPVDGQAWDESVKQLVVADEAFSAAKMRLDAAKERIKTAMEAASLPKAITPDGHKFQYAEQSGRKGLDMKRLLADNPHIKLDDYEKVGKPFKTFRHYGPKDAARWGDETLDGQLLTLKDELGIFERRSVDPDVAVELFDNLRDRTELYMRMLSLELEGLEKGVESARVALIEKMKAGK
jgi:predicted phage-related endonuclease